MRYPENLQEKGNIGFVAPSFGCATEPYKSSFDAALEKWRNQGYKTILGPNCYSGEGIGISSTPQKCAKELMEAYLNKNIDAIISCGGGELMCEILPYLDFDAIKAAEPKWYMGYSDNTNFTFTLATMCDVASVYGPCASSFGVKDEHKCLHDAMSILTGDYDGKLHGYDMWELEGTRDADHPCDGYNLTEKTILRRYVMDGKILTDSTKQAESISMSGRLLGGCLDCLVNLCGTKFDCVSQFNKKYGNEGVLWYLEACDLNVMSIRRAVWELENAGWFECASGFVIGRPAAAWGENMMGLDQYNAVYDILSHHIVPILMDADLGHMAPSVPLVTGSFAEVTAKVNEWKITMKYV